LRFIMGENAGRGDVVHVNAATLKVFKIRAGPNIKHPEWEHCGMVFDLKREDEVHNA